jgi:hypothetical protein
MVVPLYIAAANADAQTETLMEKIDFSLSLL